MAESSGNPLRVRFVLQIAAVAELVTAIVLAIVSAETHGDTQTILALTAAVMAISSGALYAASRRAGRRPS